MKMTYKTLTVRELKQSLKSLLPEAKEFEVELSTNGNAPATLYTGAEVMSLECILELVEKQGFKVNDIDGCNSEGGLRECIGITLNKPFIHEKTKERIEGLFILGNVYEKEINGILYSFLIRAVKDYTNVLRVIDIYDNDFSVDFSVDVVEKNRETAKASIFEKINSFNYLSKEGEIRLVPVTYNGEWVEMEPEEDEGEIRFQIEELTLERINKMFVTVEKVYGIYKETDRELFVKK